MTRLLAALLDRCRADDDIGLCRADGCTERAGTEQLFCAVHRTCTGMYAPRHVIQLPAKETP